ncbi:MAG: recombinase family protein [Promicromonosporaceae bacterium]|nr:recombinase family protein [Promicromonosporaceae bacterium]
MASISEFYSRNLSAEVTKGLRQKAITGGTINRAPLGYINIRQTDASGREVRTVDVDPARAPLIAWAFEAYATGEWSLSDLCSELELRGLTSLPTPKRPAKLIRINTLARMLHNPYYKGEVVYKGARHMGTHDPLVNDLVWAKVQDMLDAHNKAGDRTQVHDHYLKGSLYCHCGSKMTVNMTTNRHGETYPYFVCLGRHTKRNSCTAQAVLVSTVERLVEDHYATVEISPEASEALEGMIGEIFARIDATSEQEREALARQAQKLEDQQLKLLQSFYDDAITATVHKREQQRVEEHLQQIKARLEAFEMGCKDAQLRIRAYLAMATNAQDFYLCLDPAARRLCNQAFFTKIILTEDWRIEHTFEDVYDTIMQPENRLRADYWQRTQQLHPDIDLTAPLPPDLARDRVGTSNLWWSIGDSNS